MSLDRSKSSILLWASLCTFLAFSFYKTVYLGFERIRVPFLEGTVSVPFNEDAVVLTFESDSNQRQNFQRIVLRIRNDASEDRDIAIFLNNHLLAGLQLPALASRKMIVPLREKRQFLERRNRLKLKGSGGSWTVERAEVTNYLGSSKGVIDYVVVGSHFLPSVTPSAFAAGIVFLILLGAGMLANPLRGAIQRIFAVTAASVLLFFLILLGLPLVTEYRLLLSGPTFALLLSPIFFPLFIKGYKFFWRVPEENSWVSSVWGSFVCVLVGLFFYSSMYQLYRQYGDYSGFLQLSKRWTSQNPFLNERPELKRQLKIYERGYDGQFMYFISFDPFLRRFSDDLFRYRKWIDNPPYRYGRIGFPLLTAAVSWNEPARFPRSMIYLIVVSNIVAVFFLAKIALLYRRSPLWALAYLLIPAFSVSLRLGLPESIAAAFLLGGIFFYLRKEVLISALFFACTLLVRETGAIAVLFLSAFELFRNRNRRTALILGLSLLPLLMWRISLSWRMFSDYGLLAIPIRGGDLTIPFAGMIRLWFEVGKGDYTGGSAMSAILYPAILSFALVLSLFNLRRNRGAFSLLFTAYALFAICFSYAKVWCYIPNGERVAYEVFVLLCIAFFSVAETDRKAYRYAMVIFFTMVMFYDLFFLSAAPSFRAGISAMFSI